MVLASNTGVVIWYQIKSPHIQLYNYEIQLLQIPKRNALLRTVQRVSSFHPCLGVDSFRHLAELVYLVLGQECITEVGPLHIFRLRFKSVPNIYNLPQYLNLQSW